MAPSPTPKTILPPAWIGVMGGGQLGRFFVLAAQEMGYSTMVWDPDPEAPAGKAADYFLNAPYDDKNALMQMGQCAGVTVEFENVSVEAMKELSNLTRVTPQPNCVAIAQNRIYEKAAIRQAGLPTAPYQVIASLDDVNEETAKLLPGILKTATQGYDGKGQMQIDALTGLHAAVMAGVSKGQQFVLEKKLDLVTELSVIVCRLDDKNIVCYPPIENKHKDGILRYSYVPARVNEQLMRSAQKMAVQMAQALNYVGVLCVEMFVVGQDNRLMVNEIAPRPHNSGHFTIDACSTSQYQQQTKILCGFPPGSPRLLSACVMANILGDAWGANGAEPNWGAVAPVPTAYLHLYHKKEARPGRKMGHFTVLGKTVEECKQTAEQLSAKLQS